MGVQSSSWPASNSSEAQLFEAQVVWADSYRKEQLELLVFSSHTSKFRAWSRRGHCHLEEEIQFSASWLSCTEVFALLWGGGDEAGASGVPKGEGGDGGARRGGAGSWAREASSSPQTFLPLSGPPCSGSQHLDH